MLAISFEGDCCNPFPPIHSRMYSLRLIAETRSECIIGRFGCSIAAFQLMCFRILSLGGVLEEKHGSKASIVCLRSPFTNESGVLPEEGAETLLGELLKRSRIVSNSWHSWHTWHSMWSERVAALETDKFKHPANLHSQEAGAGISENSAAALC